MSEEKDKQEKQGPRFSQVVAGALAAATAAVLGSTLGMAGTVIGAAIASVISTVGGALYLRSLERTRESVLTVRARVVSRMGTVVSVDKETTTTTTTDGGDTVVETTDAADEDAPDQVVVSAERPRRALRPWTLVMGGVLAFVLGMAVVTGLEWVRGEPLSGGQGTTVGELVNRPAQRAPAPTAPVRESDPAQAPTTTTAPEATTTTESAEPSTGATTSTPPSATVTTTDAPATTAVTTTTGSVPSAVPDSAPPG
jgi:hypothetical protein